VALCFVAVLGIALASYLAITRQAMTISDASYQTNIGQQLAESGIEQALTAFNTNNWTGWTISGTTATRTIAVAAGKYGNSGISGTIALRVDNYDAFWLPWDWASGISYKVGDVVSHNGVWYTCMQAHTSAAGNQPSNPGALTHWAPPGLPWAWTASKYYEDGRDLVCVNGTWYRCNDNHTSGATFDATKWDAVPTPHFAWSNFPTYYAVNTYVYHSNVWYRTTTAHFPWMSFNAAYFDGNTPPTWGYRAATNYRFGDIVYYNNTWFRYVNASASSGITPGSNSAYWNNFTDMSAWSASRTYTIGDVVNHSGQWYRCIRDNTNLAPSTNASYWENGPLRSHAWSKTGTYGVNDVTWHDGQWYLCISAHTGQDPSQTAYWTSASVSSSRTWSKTANYAVGAYASYGGVWYRCTVAHTNKAPNDSGYWTAANAAVIYAQGTTSSPQGTSVKVQLRAHVAPASPVPNAIAARNAVNVSSSSSSGLIDSYNAHVADYSAGTAGSNATLAGAKTDATAVTLGGGKLRGYVAAPSSTSSPYAPLFSYGGSAIVTASGSSGVDLTRVSRSPYIPMFGIRALQAGVTLPVSTSWPSNRGLVIGVPGSPVRMEYTYSGAADLDDDTGARREWLIIAGPVTVNFTGDLRVRNSGRIIVTPTGSAVIKFNGRLRLEGSGVIDNQTKDPASLVFVSDVTSAGGTHQITTTSPFHGIIYMPNATNAVEFSSSSPGFYGAITAGDVNFITYPNFHYDTSLRSGTVEGIESRFTASEVRVLDAEERAQL
jgi:hypothetical protein